MSRGGEGAGNKPVCITLGDPVGVGPEVLVKALVEAGLAAWPENFLIIGSESPLLRAARLLDVSLEYEKVSLPIEGSLAHVALLEPPDVDFPERLAPGRPDADSAWLSFKYLELGAKLALEDRVSCLVTLPVSKSLIARKVPDFRGHTEYLQEAAAARHVRMMLSAGGLRIALVTTHCPLSEVARRLTSQGVSDTIRITHEALTPVLGREPAIVVCALNPHAGDSGLLGGEESEIITPGVIAAENRGIRCVGPYPADAALAMTARGEYDAAVAMYHDQALIALRLKAPNEGVNVTLGLPFVRTSPLHGTGYDIAGRGIAVENSLVDALRYAVGLARNRDVSGGA